MISFGFFYYNAIGNAPRVTLSPAPEFRDDFETAGNLNGRTGWSVLTRTGFSSQVNSITAASGKAGGTTGSAAYALHTAGADDVRVDCKIGVIASSIYLHANVDATDANRDFLWFNMQQSVSGGLKTGLLSMYKIVNGVSTQLTSYAQIRPEIGDVFGLDLTTSAGTNYATIYQNGRVVGVATDITAATTGVALTRKHGIIGNAGAATLESFQIGKPATEHVISLYQPNRTCYLNSDGSITWRLSGSYSMSAPSAADCTIFSYSSGSSVEVSGGRLSDLASAAGTWTATYTASAGEAASGGPFSVLIESACLAGISCAEGPLQYPGYVIGSGGQSLNNTLTSQTATTDAFVAPPNCFWIDGSPTSQSVLGANYTRKQYPMSDNTTPAAVARGFFSAAGKAMTLIKGGVGGTTIAQRTVGTASHNAQLDGFSHAGSRVHAMIWRDGESDVSNFAGYAATLSTTLDDFALRNGGSIKVVMCPVTAAWSTAGGTDEDWQSMRGGQYRLTLSEPTRYFEGAYGLDLQKADNLHLTANGYGELGRRIGYQIAKALGLSAQTRTGPKMYSVTKLSNTSVYVLYDLGGADSLELVNTAYAGEFHGGMVFSSAATRTGGTIATKIYPTNAVVDAAPSGGRQGITFTIPSIAGSIYVFAGYGKDPHNPNNTAAIQADMAGKASMIRAVRAGEPSIGLCPYFTPDGTDYMVAA